MPDEPVDGLQDLFGSADLESFQEAMRQSQDSYRTTALDAEVYRACFRTKAGKQVLQDLYSRFVNASRWNPHEKPEAGFYREGMAQVVFEICANIMAPTQQETDQ